MTLQPRFNFQYYIDNKLVGGKICKDCQLILPFSNYSFYASYTSRFGTKRYLRPRCNQCLYKKNKKLYGYKYHYAYIVRHEEVI
jgi:hypothetical protein